MTTCPFCDKLVNVKTTREKDTFRYGIGIKQKEITVIVPVRTCPSCEKQWTDYKAEDIRDQAIKQVIRNT